MKRFHLDSEYTGPRWTYGLPYRPASTFTLPSDWIVQSEREDSRFRPHGIIDFSRKLSKEETESFQLVYLGETK